MKLSVNISRACYKGVPVLRNISFSLKEKSLVAVIGRNGAGKSTLISAVSDLLAFDGEITVDGRDIRTYKRKELTTFNVSASVIRLPFTILLSIPN